MNKYIKMGLTEERYTQMMKSFDNNESRLRKVIDEWGIDNVNRGYAIFDFDGIGLLQIEAIIATEAFDCSDDKAAQQANKDGIKIIPVKELPENFDRRYFGWIDTPENRERIQEYCKKDNYYCNGNSNNQ